MIKDMQKKPTTYLLVILPIFAIGGSFLVTELLEIYALLAGTSLSSIPSLNGLLISLPALVLWVPVTLLLSNYVLYAIPPLRKIAETYATQAKRPGFLGSQKQLRKSAFFMALACLPLIILGFVL